VTGAAQGAVVTVVSSGGFAGAFRFLGSAVRAGDREHCRHEMGAVDGESPRTPFLPGESIDVVIMVGAALGDLIKAG
jgi:hypothetical protein